MRNGLDKSANEEYNFVIKGNASLTPGAHGRIFRLRQTKAFFRSVPRKTLFHFWIREKIAMRKIPDYFGELVFDDRVMKEALPADTYDSLKKTIG